MPALSKRVSLCTIVANSEDTLPRYLAWALQRFAEVVIVRSASQDRTDAILTTAERAMPGRIKLYYREIDDLSRQKQFSVDRASNDWVLVVDADEVVMDADWDSVVGTMEQKEIDLLQMPRYNLQTDEAHYSTQTYPDHQARLFHRGRVRFNLDPQFRTHHRMDGARRSSRVSDVHIVHWGNIRPGHQLNWKSQVRKRWADTDYIEGKELLEHENWFAERNREFDQNRAPLQAPVRAWVAALPQLKI